MTLPSGAAPGQAIGFGALSGPFTPVDPNHPLPVTGRAEGFAVAAANSAAAAVSVSGGDYILAQQCAAYGTVTLRGRGPDGASMVPLLTLSAADTGGGSGVTLGAGAVVDLVLSGTTGCNATLTRVPSAMAAPLLRRAGLLIAGLLLFPGHADAGRYLPVVARAAGQAIPALPAAPVAPPPLPLAMPRVMAFGDSHAQYQQLGSGSASNRPSGLWETAWAADPRFNFDWWVSQTSPLFSHADGALQGLGGDHLDRAHDGGSNPTFIDGCLNRTTYAINRAPQIVWVSCGTNSIASGDNSQQPSSAAYVIAKLDAIVGQFTSRGIWVILPTEYPRGDWPVGDARRRTVLAVNGWIRAQAGRTGVKVYDAYAALLDPADPTGTMPNPALFQEGAAGVHVNQAGAWVVYGGFLKPVIEAMIAPGSQIVTDPADATNLIPAAQALLNGGTAGQLQSGVTGTAPSGTRVQILRGTSTVVSSIEDAGAYKREVLTITPVNDSAGTAYHEANLYYNPTKVTLKSPIPQDRGPAP